MRGTKANLVIRQGAEQNFQPVLYIEPVANDGVYAAELAAGLQTIQAGYPGVNVLKKATGWQVVIPAEYHTGHEAHFTQVMENFLEHFQNGNIPDWEAPNMLAKYFTTTSALQLAIHSNN
jgi:hypothetical protein